ncbi:hypothetical protein M1271_06685 [Patescibacteria group bacterium]|nr:hypothetical protein [Patescibacteria group bacterium]MCL5798387.1 hypothetical protein [Patescibacteria group bacterium]
MDNSQNGSLRNFIIIIILLVIIGGSLLFIKSRAKMVSPVPPQPNFQVIYYTPTPGTTSPTSTPSATPKVKSPTSTPVPKPKVSPTKEVQPSPTSQSASPTPTLSQ